MEEEFDKSIELLKRHKQYYIIQKFQSQDTLEAKNQYIKELTDIDEQIFRYYKKFHIVLH